ncbi:MAG TPA: ImmA/IrrE family metallo-endopeptidase [Pyrinomonadaceae bacterium]|jgi:Zn-dependent peptidase ImmA (M78 family)|nr:ImmA/IrrE family metallo-endopeptidase [Pyrinomonadaceae bacterium]
MNLALAAIKRALPDFGERPFTAEDFRRACRRLKVKAHTIPLNVDGFYMFTKRGGAHIYINARLCGLRWLYVAWHELMHHVLHAPPDVTVAFFCNVRPDSKEDREAEVFASVALLPEAKLRRMLQAPPEEWEPGFTQQMIEFRLKVLDTYGI